MWRRLLLISVLMGISASLLSAQKISTDFCCPHRNSARIAQSLITMYGDSCVAQILDYNFWFVAAWKLDTLQHVVELEFCTIKGGDSLKVRNMVDELTCFLKERQVFFDICRSYEDAATNDYVEQEMREGRKKISTRIVFPLYDSQQKSAREQGNNLTRLDYVKQYIKKYLPDGLQSDR